jgi:endonuclease YncB( thermonuclease family)
MGDTATMWNADFTRARLVLGAMLIFTSMATTAGTLVGNVIGITDGDTLTLLVDRQAYKVRIAGIDAPERRQAWGEKSKTNLSRLAFNQKAVADCPKVDRWGRQICKVTVNAVDIGLEQIKDGMAWWYRKYSKEQSADGQSAYESAELMAKLRRLGLWSNTNPVPPWDFRRGDRP